MYGVSRLCPEPQACGGLSRFFLVNDKPKALGLELGTPEGTKFPGGS